MRISGNSVLALVIVMAGIALGAGGLYIGHIDDAPGAGMLGILLATGSVVFAVKLARRKSDAGV